jgi:hypothetical protein
MIRARDVPFGQEALSSASFFLGSSVNSFQSLQLLAVGTNPQEALKNRAININLTINGTCGLLRQILEGAVVAKWIIDAPNDQSLMERGFAYVWENAVESIKHSKSLDSPQVESQLDALRELADQAIKVELMSANEKHFRKWKPNKEMADVTGLLRAVCLPKELVSDVQESMGTKSSNGEWLYRWLSGMAHGYAWVNRLERIEVSSERVLGYTKPDIVRLGLAATMSINLIEQVLKAIHVD